MELEGVEALDCWSALTAEGINSCKVVWYMYTVGKTTDSNLTFLPLFHLKSEVEGTNGKVDGLWVGLPHGAEQVENVGTLTTNKAR